MLDSDPARQKKLVKAQHRQGSGAKHRYDLPASNPCDILLCSLRYQECTRQYRFWVGLSASRTPRRTGTTYGTATWALGSRDKSHRHKIWKRFIRMRPPKAANSTILAGLGHRFSISILRESLHSKHRLRQKTRASHALYAKSTSWSWISFQPEHSSCSVYQKKC